MKKIFLIAVLLCPIAVSAATLNGLINDVKVVYFFDNEDNIDWPLIYYLAADQGCQIEIAGISLGPALRCENDRDLRYDLGLCRCLVPDTSAVMIDSACRLIFGIRAPEVVVMSGDTSDVMQKAIANYIKTNADMPGLFSRIRALYHRTGDKQQAKFFSNGAFYIARDGEEIERMVWRLEENPFDRDRHKRYTMYRADDSLWLENAGIGAFAGKAAAYSPADAINDCVFNSSLREALSGYARKYEFFISNAAAQSGAKRLETMTSALGELENIKIDFRPTGGGPECEKFVDYIKGRVERVVSAILYETGFVFEGEALLMKTAEGDVLKISTTSVNNGTPDYRVRRLDLKSESALHNIILDSIGFSLASNQTIRRDYVVTIPAESLSSIHSDRLYVEGDLVLGDRHMIFRGDLTEPDKKMVKLTFIPSFQLVNPFEGEWVDHLVEMTQLKLLVEKPESFTAEARLEFVTPPSVHVGTYRQDISLKAGDRSYEISLPVAIGKSAGNQKHEIMATLKDGERVLGSDRARILGRECRIDENLKIALVAGTEGLLEDILRMTGAGYQTVSDRYLGTGYLGFYDILLMDTDCLERYPSLEKLGDKLKQFMQNGGKIIVFGQTGQWPEAALPISIVPVQPYPGSGGIKLNGVASDPLFNNTYQINPIELIDSTKDTYRIYPARIFPGEIIISSGSGMTLLSRTGIGSGKLIYCGYPVLDMFADLEPNGIKFFANLINFASK